MPPEVSSDEGTFNTGHISQTEHGMAVLCISSDRADAAARGNKWDLTVCQPAQSKVTRLTMTYESQASRRFLAVEPLLLPSVDQ